MWRNSVKWYDYIKLKLLIAVMLIPMVAIGYIAMTYYVNNAAFDKEIASGNAVIMDVQKDLSEIKNIKGDASDHNMLEEVGRINDKIDKLNDVYGNMEKIEISGDKKITKQQIGYVFLSFRDAASEVTHILATSSQGSHVGLFDDLDEKIQYLEYMADGVEYNGVRYDELIYTKNWLGDVKDFMYRGVPLTVRAQDIQKSNEIKNAKIRYIDFKKYLEEENKEKIKNCTNELLWVVDDIKMDWDDVEVKGRFYNGTNKEIYSIKDMKIELEIIFFDKKRYKLEGDFSDIQLAGLKPGESVEKIFRIHERSAKLIKFDRFIYRYRMKNIK